VKAVWLNGTLVHPQAAAVRIGSPLVRWGDALFETMRAASGQVRFVSQHLDRLAVSAEVLGIPIAPQDRLRHAIEVACAAGRAQHQRVRLTVAGDLVLVEVDDAGPLGPPGLARAIPIHGAWVPDHAIAEHKTASYGGYRWAARRAQAKGAEIALLADGRGYVGETDGGNVMAAIGGELVTPPVRGLLPGVARASLIGAGLAHEGDLSPELLERATELIATSAVRGVIALQGTGDESWSRDAPGPLARDAQDVFISLS